MIVGMAEVTPWKAKSRALGPALVDAAALFDRSAHIRLVSTCIQAFCERWERGRRTR